MTETFTVLIESFIGEQRNLINTGPQPGAGDGQRETTVLTVFHVGKPLKRLAAALPSTPG
jgi:hypothetical protein